MLRTGVPLLKDFLSSHPDGHRMLLHSVLGAHGQLAGAAFPADQERKASCSDRRVVVHASGDLRAIDMAAASTTAQAAPRKQRRGRSRTLRVSASAQPATAEAISLPINYFEVPSYASGSVLEVEVPRVLHHQGWECEVRRWIEDEVRHMLRLEARAAWWARMSSTGLPSSVIECTNNRVLGPRSCLCAPARCFKWLRRLQGTQWSSCARRSSKCRQPRVSAQTPWLPAPRFWKLPGTRSWTSSSEQDIPLT